MRRSAQTAWPGRGLWVLFTVVLAAGLVGAQRVSADEPPSRIVNLDVLMQPLPSYRLKAQTWGQLLRQLGYSPRFRTPRAGESVRVEDATAAGQQIVNIVGALNADGTLQVGGHRFRESELNRLKETLEDIARYGAAGPPSENPTWGLTDKQYKSIVSLMSAPVSDPVSLRSPVTAIDSIGLPPNCRLTFTAAARERALAVTTEADAPTAEFPKISKGSALAIALAQFGLGFRPLVDPAGGYVIEVDAGGEDDNLWPVGWKSTDPINRSLPDMFRSIDVSLDDVELPALVDVISDELSIPHFYSSSELHTSGIEVTELTYTRRPDRISMARLMTILGDHFGMGFDVRVAENGEFFLWVTTRDEYLAFRSRFAHVIPGR